MRTPQGSCAEDVVNNLSGLHILHEHVLRLINTALLAHTTFEKIFEEVLVALSFMFLLPTFGCYTYGGHQVPNLGLQKRILFP